MGCAVPAFVKMPYVTQEQIETTIPGPYLVDALDDDKDGAADPGKLAEVIAKASQAVESALAGLYTVPFSAPVPAKVCEAAFVFTCELIYQRRGTPEDQNPFTKQANVLRADLKAIGKGEQPLDASLERAFTPGAVVTSPMATEGSTA